MKNLLTLEQKNQILVLIKLVLTESSQINHDILADLVIDLFNDRYSIKWAKNIKENHQLIKTLRIILKEVLGKEVFKQEKRIIKTIVSKFHSKDLRERYLINYYTNQFELLKLLRWNKIKPF